VKAQGFSAYFTLKARVASLLALAVPPQLPLSYALPLGAVGVLVCAITLACEEPGSRLRVGLICSVGFLASLVCHLVFRSFLVSSICLGVCLMVCLGVLIEDIEFGSGDADDG
jgi:hypothetical protein